MAWSDNLETNTPAYHIAASNNRYIRVVAGPGTGKSFAMKRRVARLLENGIPANNILPVTFTRVAAEDLHRELVGMGVPGCEEIEGVTLHSLALQILMRNHVLGTTGRIPRPLNDFEIKPLEADLAGRHGGKRLLRKKLKAYESAWARLQRDEPGYTQSQEDAAFEQDLLAWFQFHKAMLIGEVIPYLHNYLASNPVAPERNEFTYILVDEYQDLNKAEQGVISLLASRAEVCIVGDDDQSIYSFKHAHPEGIRDWLTLHGSADDLTLDECRRCPTTVVEMANSLIAHNINRPVPRSLTPRLTNGVGDVRIIQYRSLDAEVAGVVNIISELVSQGIHPGDILVLAQRGVIGTPIYEALIGQTVPVRSYYAETELNHEDVQSRFALFKLFVDREDRVALRWLLGLNGSNWLAAGYQRLREQCENRGNTPWEILERLENHTVSLPYTNSLVERFLEIKNQINTLEQLCEQNDLAAVIDHLFPDGDTGVRDLRTLAIETIASVGTDDRQVYLRELTSAIAKPEIPSEIEEVRIMSLHKSKGLSAPVTIIAGCIEGLLPKQPDPDIPQVEQNAELEEQRRLFYVGITRVKAEPQLGKPGTLIISYSQQMPLAAAMGSGIKPASDNFGQAQLHASRFIREMGTAAPRPIAG